MAGNALGGKPLILPDCRALVASLARHGGVRAEKREAILVIFKLLRRNRPTEHGMAARAIRAHLALVDVRMAVLTILTDVCKNWIYVASGTLHFFVHAAERVFRFVMIELRNFADRPPCRGGMAVFARNR